MPAPLKQELDFFPHDTDLSRDQKIEYVEALHGLQGYAIYLKLLEKIYRNSYYIYWKDRDLIIFSKHTGIEKENCREIVFSCINEGLFKKELFEEYSVLTSFGIQKRYLKSCARRKNVTFFKELFLLTEIDIKTILGENIKVNVNIIPINVNIYSQIEREREREIESINTLSLPSEDDNGDSSSMSPHEVNTAPGNSSGPEKLPGPLTSGVKAKKRLATNSPSKKTPNSEIRMFVEFVDETYQRKFNFPFIFFHGKDEKIIQGLLSKFSLNKLKDFWLKYLDLPDEFLDEEGRDIGKFKLKINKMTSGGRKKSKPTHHDYQERKPSPEQEKAEKIKANLRDQYYTFLAEKIPLTDEQVLNHPKYGEEVSELYEISQHPLGKKAWINKFAAVIRLEMIESRGLPTLDQWLQQKEQA